MATSTIVFAASVLLVSLVAVECRRFVSESYYSSEADYSSYEENSESYPYSSEYYSRRMLLDDAGGSGERRSNGDDPGSLVYVSVEENGTALYVNLIAEPETIKQHNSDGTEQYKLLVNANHNDGEMSRETEVLFTEKYSVPIGHDGDTRQKLVHSAKLADIDPHNGTSIAYRIPGISRKNGSTVRFPSAKRMRICVFSDLTEDDYTGRGVQLSKLIRQADCEVNLFTSALTFVEVPHGKSVRYSFNPFMIRNSHSRYWESLSALHEVPSIFALGGHDLFSTSNFSVTELNGVAFIQIATDFFSTIRDPHEGRRFNLIGADEYVKTDQLMRLRCTLRALNQRPNRPWIVAFVLSALIIEPKYHLFKLDHHREVLSLLRRYNVELFLTNRHVHVPAGILVDEHGREPKDPADAVNPKVIFTTLKPCSELDADAHIVSLVDASSSYAENDGKKSGPCNYVSININGDSMNVQRRSLCEDARDGYYVDKAKPVNENIPAVEDRAEENLHGGKQDPFHEHQRPTPPSGCELWEEQRLLATNKAKGNDEPEREGTNST